MHLAPILPYAILLPLLALLLVLDFRNLRGTATWRRSLRALLWLLLIAVSLRPSLVTEEEITDRARLLIVEDRSNSMSVRDAANNRSRSEAIADARLTYAQQLQDLSKDFQVEEYHVAASTLLAGSKIDPSATALGDGLFDLGQDAQGSRVAALVLFSDGRNTSGRPLEAGGINLRAADVPVHSLVVGSTQLDEAAVDASIIDAEAPTSAETESTLSVALSGQLRNLKGKTVTVLARLNDNPAVKIGELVGKRSQARYRETFNVEVPEEAGFYTLTLELRPEGHEITPSNNVIQTPFRARDDAIRVLFLEGALRPEFKFLRRVLEDNEAFAVQIAPPFLLASPAAKPFLNELKLERFDVVILGDVPTTQLPSDLQAGLNALIRNRGAGVLILGGNRTLQPEYWKANPLRHALPLVFDSNAQAPSVQQFQPKRFELTPHFVSEGFANPNYHPLWELPLLRGIRAPQTSPIPLATVLLQDQSNRPLALASDYGAGRVICTLTDAFWNWQTEPEPAPAAHREFWTRSIYYLASRETAMNSRLSIRCGRARVRVDKPAAILADLLSETGSPVQDAQIQIRSRKISDETERARSMPFDGSRYRRELSFSEPGIYALQAYTKRGDVELFSNELRIAVFDAKQEDQNILAAPQALAQLGEQTGGTARPLLELPALLKELPKLARTVTVRRTQLAKTLWDSPLLYLLLTLSFGAYWFPLRRKQKSD